MPDRKEETFLIRIYDCQNATWQGSILWAERQQKTCFRITLQMSSLIDEPGQQDRKEIGGNEDEEEETQSKDADMN